MFKTFECANIEMVFIQAFLYLNLEVAKYQKASFQISLLIFKVPRIPHLSLLNSLLLSFKRSISSSQVIFLQNIFTQK